MNPGKNKRDYDCLVIGGGIVGLMTARELLHAGLQVALLEKGSTGMESSWAGGGILSPLYPWHDSVLLEGLVDHSLHLYPHIVEELHTETGVDPEWQKSGMLVFAIDNEEEGQLRTWASTREIPVQVMYSEQLSIFEPALCTGFDRAFNLPEVCQIRNPYLLKAMYRFLVGHGVDIHEQTEVQRLDIKNNCIQAVNTTQGDFRADIIVLANGAWGSGLLEELAIRPVRGQMICFRTTPGYLKHILLKDGLYIIPRRDGHILVGSTVEDVGFNKSTTTAARDKLITGVQELLPGIGGFPLVGHWAGLRPATQTSNPYICRHPAINDLYLNIGHYRNGLLLAPASAAILTDIILGRETVPFAGNFRFQSVAHVC